MRLLQIIIGLCLLQTVQAQNTVGLKLYDHEKSYEGVTLFDPISDENIYLIDNCGKLVHSWTSDHNPRLSSYLLPNGSLLRATRGGGGNNAFGFANSGGEVEILDWSSNELWSYLFSNDTLLQHHDIEPLPNGNILVLTWDMMTQAEAIQAGRDPSLLPDGMLWPDQIIEVEPVGSNQINEVWRWSFRDHLIQNFDATKDNFGVVADHPELLNINVVNNNGVADWIHTNSIAYNAERDEIVISSRKMSEIYIIDHSTTTVEAASHSGGNKGKGGDFLYRWGNPEVYDQGNSTDRMLYGQHDAHWIPNGYPDEGKIIIFNNGRNRTPFQYSSVDIIEPPVDGNGSYEYTGSAFGPELPAWSYENIGDDTLFASFISGAHQLPNGNVLLCDGPAGTIYEVDQDGEIGWEYVVPVNGSGIMSQGDIPTGNNTFRARRYPLDYTGLIGDLTPGNPVELNAAPSNCSPVYLNIEDSDQPAEISVYPNPASGILNISSKTQILQFKVFDSVGSLVLTIDAMEQNTFDISTLNSGMYHLVFYTGEKVINQNLVIHR